MKQFLIAFGLWLARKGGWKQVIILPCQVPHIEPCKLQHLPDSEILAVAKNVVQHVTGRFPTETNEYKRHQAMRMLFNVLPDKSERDISLAIELAVRDLDPR